LALNVLLGPQPDITWNPPLGTLVYYIIAANKHTLIFGKRRYLHKESICIFLSRFQPGKKREKKESPRQTIVHFLKTITTAY
jgi:hypothetical protein